MPTVSVVIPTWNSGAYLTEAIDSVLAQTFEDFELIVVDSNSGDGTRERISAYADPRISLIDLPFKCGVAIPTNIGILAARGEFIAMMDHDDRMQPTRLEKQRAFLRSKADVDILGSCFTLFYDGARSPRMQPSRDALIKANLLNVSGNAVHNPTVMLRKAFIDEHRLSYPLLAVDADHAMWVNCMRHGATFANLRDDLLDYRFHEESQARLESAWQHREKTPIREDILGLLFPDLTRLECRAVAVLMEKDRELQPAERFAGIQAIEKVMRISRCSCGADIRTVRRILTAYRNAALAFT